MRRMPSLALWKDLQPAERRFASSFAILSLGNGLSLSMLAVYLVRHLSVSTATYGIGMSIAALCGMVSGPLAGRFADRANRFVFYAFLVWGLAIATALIAVAGKWAALVLLSALLACGRGSAAVMGALIGDEIPAGRRVHYRAVVKTFSTMAMLIGMGLGGIVLAVNSKLVFQTGFLVEAVTLCVTGALVFSMRSRAVRRCDKGPDTDTSGSGTKRRLRSSAVRDRLFLALTMLNGVFLLYSSVLTVALPLWVASDARSMLWLVAVATVINTCAILLLQVPVSRGVKDVPDASRATRRGAILIGISILIFPAAGAVDSNAWKAAMVVVLALVVGVGEVLYSAGSWELVYGLAPSEALGEYQGVFNMGLDFSLLVGPTLFAWLASGKHTAGWIAVAAVLFAGAVLVRPIAVRRWNLRPGIPAEVSRR